MAYGLALQGLKLTRLHTNLLPQEIRTERLVRAKKPWAVTAAAAVLVGLVSMIAGYGLEYKAVAGSAVEKAKAEGKEVVRLSNQYNAAFAAKLLATLADEDKVRGIIAGKDERLNWLLLNQYLNDGLPVPAVRVEGKLKDVQAKDITITDRQGKDQKIPTSPNGVFILDPATKMPRLVTSFQGMQPGAPIVVYGQQDPGARAFWDAPGGRAQQAFLDFWKRQAEGGGGNSQGAEDDLLQVNIEAVDGRYSPDLKTLFTNLLKDDTHFKNLDALADKDRKELPDGAGWLMEVRGYTYFRQEKIFDFLKGCLVDKLVALATPEAAPPAPAGAPAPAAANAPTKSEKEDGWDKVIRGKVSHVFLYRYVTDKNPSPIQFQIIGNSVLPGLLTTAASAKGAVPAEPGFPPAGEAQPKATTVGPANWQSLLHEAAPPPAAAAAPAAGAAPAAIPGPGGAGPHRVHPLVRVERAAALRRAQGQGGDGAERFRQRSGHVAPLTGMAPAGDRGRHGPPAAATGFLNG